MKTTCSVLRYFFFSKLRVVELHWFAANYHCMYTDLWKIISNIENDSLKVEEMEDLKMKASILITIMYFKSGIILYLSL